MEFRDIRIFLIFTSYKIFFDGLFEFFKTHILLVIFVACFFSCKVLFEKGLKSLSIGSIELKQIKPVDANLNPILISYFLPCFKFYFKGNEDLIFVIGTCLIYILYIFLGKNSYHYNIILRLLGYKNYEVQTMKEMVYLLLSKETLINRNQVTKYVKISDHMIVNVSNTLKK